MNGFNQEFISNRKGTSDGILDVLCENAGRVNFQLLDGNKAGLGDKLLVNDIQITNWTIQVRLFISKCKSAFNYFRELSCLVTRKIGQITV